MTRLLNSRCTAPAYIYHKLFEENWDSMFKAFDMKARSALPTDVFEEGDAVYIEMAVSGFTKKDISIEIEDNILTVSTKNNNIPPHQADSGIKALYHSGPIELEGNRNYLQKGLAKRYFVQSYVFKDCDLLSAEASLKNGILSIKIPKLEDVSKKVVNIVDSKS